MTLDRVGTGAFSNAITADASSTLTTTGMDAANYYQSTADVTAIVQARGNGTYRVSGADIGALVNTKSDATYAAWWMVVFYQKSTDPPRNLALFDGLTLLDSGSATSSVTVTGFQVPTGSFDAKVGVVAYFGHSTGASQLLWNGSAVTDAVNPNNKFFNGTRSYLGTAVSNAGDLPQLTGDADSMSGVDIDVINVTTRRHARRHQRHRQREDEPTIRS